MAVLIIQVGNKKKNKHRLVERAASRYLRKLRDKYLFIITRDIKAKCYQICKQHTVRLRQRSVYIMVTSSAWASGNNVKKTALLEVNVKLYHQAKPRASPTVLHNNAC